MTRPVLPAATFALFTGLCGGLLASTPSAQAQGAAVEKLRFVEVDGKNLNERSFTLPSGFEADYNLVFVAFQRWHQRFVDSWVPFSVELESRFANLRFYELPTMSAFPQAFQTFVDNGMRNGIPSLDTRARTICLYIDRGPLLEGLGIANTRKIQNFLVTREGKVLWRSVGGFDKEAAQQLEQVLEQHARKRPVAKDDLTLAASKHGRVQVLLKAARAAGLVDTLRGNGPYTLLAPTDAAFAALGDERVEALLRPESRGELRKLLLGHVVRGYFDTEHLRGRKELATAAGTRVQVGFAKAAAADAAADSAARNKASGMAGEGSQEAGPKTGELQIHGRKVLAEIPCKNGVILLLDRVLLPKQAAQEGTQSDRVRRAAPQRRRI
jgi:uncharacterized surface protein with fasciclin (FAS1) repeats